MAKGMLGIALTTSIERKKSFQYFNTARS